MSSSPPEPEPTESQNSSTPICSATTALQSSGNYDFLYDPDANSASHTDRTGSQYSCDVEIVAEEDAEAEMEEGLYGSESGHSSPASIPAEDRPNLQTLRGSDQTA